MHSGEQCSSAPSTSSRAPWSPCAGVRKLLVIGAGVAGLQAAKHLRQAGYSVLLLEQADDVGGVWVRNYHDFGLQGGCTAACVGRSRSRPSMVPAPPAAGASSASCLPPLPAPTAAGRAEVPFCLPPFPHCRGTSWRLTTMIKLLPHPRY